MIIHSQCFRTPWRLWLERSGTHGTNQVTKKSKNCRTYLSRSAFGVHRRTTSYSTSIPPPTLNRMWPIRQSRTKVANSRIPATIGRSNCWQHKYASEDRPVWTIMSAGRILRNDSSRGPAWTATMTDTFCSIRWW